MPRTKYIFVTGGVVSGIGKGIASASLGLLLKKSGYKVGILKVDPYLNKDAGTMNPFQHGEVFVTEDGAETDLDLGHYERFLNQNLSKTSNFTTGTVYESVTNKERKGDFLGSTIQIIPHVTDEIKRRIKLAASENKSDFLITEIGGTVGDIEALPFIEALRQFRRDVGEKNVLYIHVLKIVYIYPSEEPKTKPIQRSVQNLRNEGIQPDLLIVRCKKTIPKDIREKIALFCDVSGDEIIQAIDVGSLYEIPLNLKREGLARQVVKKFNLKYKKPLLEKWREIIDNAKNPKQEVRVGMVGKYLDHPDAYISIVEALKHAGIHNQVKIKIMGIDSEKRNLIKKLKEVDGILIPGGFGIRGIEGKIKAVRFARENNVPFLGLCLGMQVAVIELARNLCGLKKANSSEFDSKTSHPVIDYLPEQLKIKYKGGTMRLGTWPALLKRNSKVQKLYRKLKISERHRHRYEVNPKYHQILQKKGLIFSGLSPDKKLVEFIEIKNHPFFTATQAHPEFKSRFENPHPLFLGFIKAILKGPAKS
ncbi:CTP synthase [subsurface metagenome]